MKFLSNPQAPQQFKVSTDIVVPVTSINFDSLFIDPCEDCAKVQKYHNKSYNEIIFSRYISISS